MKTVFIIAGFDIHHTAATDRFITLEEELKKKNMNIVPIDISWRQKTPSQYAQQFEEYYHKYKSAENIVIGNSFGAVVAFIAAPKIKPDLLVLGSLSPYFSEDRGKRPDAYGIKYFGKRRAEDLWSISAVKVADDINAVSIRTVVVYGEKEHQTSPLLVERCRLTADSIKDCRIVELPNSPHNMSDESYSREVAKYVD